MARWIRNTQCPKCGSRDNKAEYDDGSSWCWGCNNYGRPNISPLVLQQRRSRDIDGDSDKPSVVIPDDLTTHFGPEAVTWLTQYGMGLETLIKNGVRYSPRRNQIIFTWPDLDLWQARNLSKTTPHGNSTQIKYFKSGNHDDLLTIYYNVPNTQGNTVVLVEDCLSAIKIASGRGLGGLTFDAIPLLGTHIPTQKLNALNRLYSNLVVWLDHDKGKEAIKIANKAKLLGMKTKVVMTELDPKCYSYDDLRTILHSNKENEQVFT